MLIPRGMNHLHERNSQETSLTEQVVAMFTEERKNILKDIVLPNIYKGATFTMEGHLDIGSGNRNKIRSFLKKW